MSYHMAARAIRTAAISLLLIGVQRVEANVDIVFDPTMQTVDRETNDLFEINLVAHSDDGTPQSIDALDVILSWDSTLVELLGVDNSNAGYGWLTEGFLNGRGVATKR